MSHARWAASDKRMPSSKRRCEVVRLVFVRSSPNLAVQLLERRNVRLFLLQNFTNAAEIITTIDTDPGMDVVGHKLETAPEDLSLTLDTSWRSLARQRCEEVIA